MSMELVQCQSCGYCVEEKEYCLPDGWVERSRTVVGGRLTFGYSTGVRRTETSTISGFYCDVCQEHPDFEVGRDKVTPQ